MILLNVHVLCTIYQYYLYIYDISLPGPGSSNSTIVEAFVFEPVLYQLVESKERMFSVTAPGPESRRSLLLAMTLLSLSFSSLFLLSLERVDNRAEKEREGK